MSLSFTILLPGVPVTSQRGALGWCSVALIRSEGRNILFDTGSCGDRSLLLQRLNEEGLSPDRIDIVVISHFHFDHFLNAEIFPNAALMAPSRDLEYTLSGEYLESGDPYVPIGSIRYLKDRISPVEAGEEVVPGLEVMALPGHTPGTIGLYHEQDKILFASDAVKNGWEFLRNEPPPAFFSRSAALENYARVREKARIIVPGHDRPFIHAPGNGVHYLDQYRTEIRSYADPEKEGTIHAVM